MSYWDALARAIGWAIIILGLSVATLAVAATFVMWMFHIWSS